MSRPVTSSAPRQELNARQAETVANLLAAGLAELRSVGHEALTVRTVAQRAGVSPATAYTYFSSKNHLFAELFWRHLADGVDGEGAGGGDAAGAEDATGRLQSAVRTLTGRIVAEPELAAAVTPALLGGDPDVERLRLRIGAEFYARFEAALAGPRRPAAQADADVLEAVVLAFTGALLHAGMGLLTYDRMADRLVAVVRVIMRGNV